MDGDAGTRANSPVRWFEIAPQAYGNFQSRSASSRMAGGLPSDGFGDDLITEIKHLRAFAISLSGSVSASDDLMQEALLRPWSKSDQFRDGTNLRALVANDLAEHLCSSFRFSQARPRGADGGWRVCASFHGLGDQEGHSRNATSWKNFCVTSSEAAPAALECF